MMILPVMFSVVAGTTPGITGDVILRRAAALLIIVLMVYAVTGWTGLFIMVVGTGIGLIPVLFGSRRLNCLGVLLLPIACNMSGIGTAIAGFLGLI